jgi:hypothetical protein
MHPINRRKIMQNKMRALLLAGLILSVAATAWAGQFYRYTDENGVPRYTDNLANVPPEQRENMATHESVASSPVRVSKSVPSVSSGTASTQPSQNTANARTERTGSWREGLAQRKEAAQELDRMQADLSETFQSLQSERSALAARQPSPGATEEVMQTYREQVEVLNRKIEHYENQLKVFKEKEAAFEAVTKQ